LNKSKYLKTWQLDDEINLKYQTRTIMFPSLISKMMNSKWMYIAYIRLLFEWYQHHPVYERVNDKLGYTTWLYEYFVVADLWKELDYLVLFHITWQVNLQNWKSCKKFSSIHENLHLFIDFINFHLVHLFMIHKPFFKL
jgi:hypothetical protein